MVTAHTWSNSASDVRSGCASTCAYCDQTSLRPAWQSPGTHTAPAPLQHADDDLDSERTTIWFAGKALVASKKLSDYLGRHEKTKAVVKLTRAGQGAPAREQVKLFCLSTPVRTHGTTP